MTTIIKYNVKCTVLTHNGVISYYEQTKTFTSNVSTETIGGGDYNYQN